MIQPDDADNVYLYVYIYIYICRVNKGTLPIPPTTMMSGLENGFLKKKSCATFGVYIDLDGKGLYSPHVFRKFIGNLTSFAAKPHSLFPVEAAFGSGT